MSVSAGISLTIYGAAVTSHGAAPYVAALRGMMESLARSASCPSVTVTNRLGSPLGKSLDSSESRLFIYVCIGGNIS